MAVGVLAVYGGIQILEAYVILPLIMRGAVNIHPAVTLFTVVLWGKIFGVPGLMLAIPINLTIWTLLDHFSIRPREAALSG
jgi:predicted PurR-regulated permease PerM